MNIKSNSVTSKVILLFQVWDNERFVTLKLFNRMKGVLLRTNVFFIKYYLYISRLNNNNYSIIL